MKELKRLIDVKSIVTLTLTLVVAYMTIYHGYDIKDIYIVIISFYFGTQHAKYEKRGELND